MKLLTCILLLLFLATLNLVTAAVMPTHEFQDIMPFKAEPNAGEDHDTVHDSTLHPSNEADDAEPNAKEDHDTLHNLTLHPSNKADDTEPNAEEDHDTVHDSTLHPYNKADDAEQNAEEDYFREDPEAQEDDDLPHAFKENTYILFETLAKFKDALYRYKITNFDSLREFYHLACLLQQVQNVPMNEPLTLELVKKLPRELQVNLVSTLGESVDLYAFYRYRDFDPSRFDRCNIVPIRKRVASIADLTQELQYVKDHLIPKDWSPWHYFMAYLINFAKEYRENPIFNNRITKESANTVVEALKDGLIYFHEAKTNS